AGLAHHLHVRRRPHHDREAAADQRLVVGDYHPDHVPSPNSALLSSSRGRLARTRKPPAYGPASSLPPNRAARSRIPIRPWPPPARAIGRGACPRGPSSVTSMLSS